MPRMLLGLTSPYGTSGSSSRAVSRMKLKSMVWRASISSSSRFAAPGFAIWITPNVAVAPGDHPPLLSSVLQLAVASSSVNVTLPPHELAAEQLKSEEKQRLLGVLPDFFVSYAPNAAPLTAAQKFQLGWKTIIDPVSLLGTSISAGIQQARNNYPEFGQGTEGYAKRFGAQYANRVSRVIIGRVVMQSIFHQDPRYFYKRA